MPGRGSPRGHSDQRVAQMVQQRKLYVQSNPLD
uniref:Uncharacterized protein n=1 Tax=Peronospora matthiolae TaxID=2874970 RepID=A0AAV1V2B3_9STRA